MTLRYDATGLKPSVVGDARGVSDLDRSRLRPRLLKAHQAIRTAHERGELGFIDCPQKDPESILSWAAKKRAEGFREQVVIGIGGSSLGSRALYEALAEDPHAGEGSADGLRTHFTENIDPVGVARLFDRLDLSKTLFIVVTKSGSTVETMSKFWLAFDRVCSELGEDKARAHFVAITGPKNDGLRALADHYGFDSFEVPTNVGGRFSVLTPVGLVPLALAGIDIRGLLAGAKRARECAALPDFEHNTLLQITADIFTLYERGVDQIVMMSYSDQLLPIADWFRQLWAESLGKAKDRGGNSVHVGMTPIKALGVIDQHSQVQLYMEGPNDKLMVFLEVASFGRELKVPTRPGLPASLAHLAGLDFGDILDAELQGTRRALQEAGRPTSTWRFDGVQADDLGSFIFAWEFITALMGELFDIDAFDQPGVELGKKLAHGLLGREGFEQWAKLAQSNADAGAARSIDDEE
ncbi:glucose-6-phosphate isomerase [Bradymonas sediminis]|uniref:Glucose-6-phosphate isomerase n=1 Tax=Bradymonas sediminis TaxID=1548548 RepID=A0A2Z4FK35_9DELT|nr:glucose-6-phosphate isomerase [Bradymonas sediminis]AWV89337.1 glucose-6-phosphate isomerase [Bradymonas sediminis]TDP73513.1 glucose-6-phosphate isomerase [Bradymonas sediminis]